MSFITQAMFSMQLVLKIFNLEISIFFKKNCSSIWKMIVNVKYFCNLSVMSPLKKSVQAYESSSSRKWYFSCLKMRSTNPFQSFKNHTFDYIWSIPLLNHNGKISKRHFKTSCMTVVQNMLIPIPPYHKRAKTGLRPRFYLNCSHIFLMSNN